uniref:2-polyprenyl-6-methoxyphenol hydroxylase-like oxidoreductase n=1 Tax=Desulfovibrio sp. U5L TaxID=596152 RepID=I2PX46_9BACT
MRIAINGAGIAGPALAVWLLRSGHEPTLIEKSPHFRTGGYMIDFWGVGYAVAEKMGILPEVLKAGYPFKEVRILDERGRKAGGFSVDVFRRVTKGRYISLPRGDLAATIYRTVEDRIGNSIAAIEQNDATAHVAFEHGPSRDFDLVVGADGLHSRVRQLVFGPQDRFERRLGCHVAIFEAEGYRPRDELVYVACATPGRQVGRIALRGDRTMFLFVFRDELMSGPEPSDPAEMRAILRGTFGNMGWETFQILEAMDEAEDIYFDRVSQIRMEAWSTGRVVLLGDAASAVSLLAGEGTGLAMAEASVLAGKLHRAEGDHRVAFLNYERRLRSFVEGKQRSAQSFASTLVPRTPLGVWFRNQTTRLLRLPVVAEFLLGRSLSVTDDFNLPEYDI